MLRPKHLVVFLAGFAMGVALLLSCGGGGDAAAHSVFETTYTAVVKLNTTNSVTADATWQPVGPALPFTKLNAFTNIEVLLNSRAGGGTPTGGAAGVVLELRVDGSPTSSGIHNRGSVLTANGMEFVSIFAAFPGLAAGPHVAQVWIYCPFGTVTGVGLDPGGFDGGLIVREVP